MSNYQPVREGKDPVLWEIAQKRASFKTHAVVYVLVNVFLWSLWYFNNFNHGDSNHSRWGEFPWPIWTTLGWGIGLAFHFAGAYLFPKANSVETEYQKLKNKNTSN